MHEMCWMKKLCVPLPCSWPDMQAPLLALASCAVRIETARQVKNAVRVGGFNRSTFLFNVALKVQDGSVACHLDVFRLQVQNHRP